MRWMWIDQIIDFEPEQRLTAVKHVSLSEDHLHDHFPPAADRPAMPIMPATLMIEGMAQTGGVLVGSVNRFREKVVLAKVQAAEFDLDVLPGQTIRYAATLERIDRAGGSTTGHVDRYCYVERTWRDVGRIDLIFSHLDQNAAGQKYPEHNFVFSDNFRMILDQAGLGALWDAEAGAPGPLPTAPASPAS